MRHRRLLVAAAMALAFVSTQAAARTQAKKQINNKIEIAKTECFRDEDRPGARTVCPAQSAPPAAMKSYAYAARGGGSTVLILEARRYEGMTAAQIGLKRRTLWCAEFMNMVMQRTGYRGSGSNKAASFAAAGRRVSGPQVGALAVMRRGRNGGHVGIVTGVDGDGNPIIVSGNHNNKVMEAVYPRARVYAYVMPSA